MCDAVTCQQRGKTTWSGCGQHVDTVKRGVPAAQWCAGNPDAPRSGGLLSRLFGR